MDTAGRQNNEFKKSAGIFENSAPDHTANQWIVNQYGNHEMSNMVYKFFWREYERIEWDRVKEQSVPVAWEITWNVTFNTPQNPDYSGRGRQIAGQDKKVFKDRAAMEKYLQGRISAYAHLFTEISPPIPEEHKKRFFVNGVLLPGYTVETPQLTQPDPNTVDDLLSYLDDDDMPSFQQPEEPPAPAPSKAAAKKNPLLRNRARCGKVVYHEEETILL